MNNKLAYGIAVVSLSGVLVAPVQAESNYYLTLGAGTTEADDTCDELDDLGFAGSCDDTDVGWKIAAGYQFNQYFGAELFYSDIGEADAEGVIGATAATADVDIDGFGLALTGAVPLGEKFSLIGRVGIYSWDADGSGSAGAVTISADDDGTDMVYGIGGQYDFTDRLGLRIEWEHYDDVADDDLEMISASVVFSF